jgi:hypothetical protein
VVRGQTALAEAARQQYSRALPWPGECVPRFTSANRSQQSLNVHIAQSNFGLTLIVFLANVIVTGILRATRPLR